MANKVHRIREVPLPISKPCKHRETETKLQRTGYERETKTSYRNPPKAPSQKSMDAAINACLLSTAGFKSAVSRLPAAAACKAK